MGRWDYDINPSIDNLKCVGEFTDRKIRGQGTKREGRTLNNIYIWGQTEEQENKGVLSGSSKID